MSGAVSRWLGGIDKLEAIVTRISRVQLENKPAIEVIKLYDSRESLFYCDPPYLHETRGDIKAYRYEMSNSEHEELSLVLNNCKGKVAVSGYADPLMDLLYPPGKWRKIPGELKTIHSTKDARQEILWVNY